MDDAKPFRLKTSKRSPHIVHDLGHAQLELAARCHGPWQLLCINSNVTAANAAMPPDNATCLTDDALLSHIRTPLIIETCSGLCHGIAACAHATTNIQGHNMCALGILGQDSTRPQHFWHGAPLPGNPES
eukprot:7867662-Alexandrium_andersonii.AAC.1